MPDDIMQQDTEPVDNSQPKSTNLKDAKKYCSCGGRRPIPAFSNKYDVPYGAGYNWDGTCIYIDRRLPRSFKDSTGQTVDIHKYLVLHEIVEKNLIDMFGISYNEAHTIAMGAESTALLKDGINYDEYYGYIGKFISYDIDPRDIRSVPSDLDETPYIEDKLDEVVKKIRGLKDGTIKPNPSQAYKSNMNPSSDVQYSTVNEENVKTANDIDNHKAF